MPLLERAYTLALHAAQGALPLLARGDGKLARGLRGRRGVLERMAVWADAHRDPSRPLVWFHAASVGEGLQARPVMEALRARRPDVQVAYTFFSPSAESLARRLPADFIDYLPIDLPAEVAGALERLRPSVLAFSKYDVWPNLSREAVRRGVRLALLSATLPPSSSRLRGPARALLRPAYGRLDAVVAISQADADRFQRLGVPAASRWVMGDARFDQVWQRARAVDPDATLLRTLRDAERLTLVAGSSWGPDEERLLPAWAALGSRPRRLILVPHEPTEAHLAEAERLADRYGLSTGRLSALEDAQPRDVLLVDRLGILGDLYCLADLAYVGGGWGRAGLHSVLEPAAFGVPVLFGPRHANAREAGELVQRGGAFAPASAEELRRRLRELVEDSDQRRTAGDIARRYVEEGIGAALRGAEVVERLLSRPGAEGRG